MPQGEIQLGSDTSITWKALAGFVSLCLVVLIPFVGWLYAIDNRSRQNEDAIAHIIETQDSIANKVDQSYDIQADIRDRFTTIETKMDVYFGNQSSGVLNR